MSFAFKLAHTKIPLIATVKQQSGANFANTSGAKAEQFL